jgi:hypothetical protein
MIAYIDESGIHEKSRAVVVGGLVARAHSWSRFEQTWGNCLRTAGVSQYHASQLESRLGEYKGWSQARKVGFQKELISAIKRATSYGVACGLPLSEYRAVKSKDDGLPSAYMLCVMGAVIKVAEWSKEMEHKKPVDFILESGGPERGEVVQWFNARRRIQSHIGSISFANKSVLPLHGADFYAYEAWKYFENNVVSGQRDIRKSLEAIVHLPYMDAWAYDRVGLQDLVTQMKARRAAARAAAREEGKTVEERG